MHPIRRHHIREVCGLRCHDLIAVQNIHSLVVGVDGGIRADIRIGRAV